MDHLMNDAFLSAVEMRDLASLICNCKWMRATDSVRERERERENASLFLPGRSHSVEKNIRDPVVELSNLSHVSHLV